MAHSRSRAITRVEIAAGLVIVCALCSGTARADDEIVDWDGWRVHVENWIGAASVAVPSQVGALATGLSAMPSSVNGGLTFTCHQNMQRITLELGEPNLDPAREAELQLMMDKNQHVLDALNGKPEGLRRFITKLEQQGGGAAPAAPAPTMLDDDRDSMEFYLAHYSKQIAALQERASKERNRFDGLRSEGEKLVDGLDDIAKGAETTRELLARPFAVNDEACRRLMEIDRRINGYAVSVVDAKAACETALAEAERTAASCRSQADGDLIRARYEEAKRHAAQMTRDVEHILAEAGERTRLLDLVQKLDPTDVAMSTRERTTADLTQVEQDRTTVERVAADLQASRATLVDIETEAKELLTKVRRHRDDYVPLFSQSADRWQALIDSLVKDLAFTAPERDEATLGWEEAARHARHNLQALLDLELSTCKADERTPRMVEEAVAARDMALLKLGAAEHVLEAANDCGRQPAVPQAVQPTPTPVAPSIQLLPTTATTGPSLAGGLRIRGPASMTDGQRVVFVGTDGAGTPYPGGVTWNTSATDVLLIGADGGAVAEKPGHATVIAHKDGMTAFFDVQVLPAETPADAAAGFSSAGGGAAASGTAARPGSNVDSGVSPADRESVL